MTNFIKENKIYLFYYLALAIVTISITKVNVEYSSIARFFYLCAVIAPAIKCIRLLPLSIIIFWGFSRCSFTPMFPSTIILEILVITAVLLSSRLSVKMHKPALVLMILYFFFSDIVMLPEQDLIWPVVLVTFLISFTISSMDDIRIIGISFVFLSLMLSTLYLLNYQDFAAMYSFGDSIERSSWINPNEFGGNIAIGIAAGSWLLFNNHNMDNRWLSYIIIVSMLVSITVLVMNASRGSIIAAVLCFLYYVLKSKNAFFSKIIIVAVFVGFVYYLFINNYFELLFYRLSNTDNSATAGQRTIIWTNKIQYFSNQNLFYQLFGLGIDGCDNAVQVYKTHNDFVTALVAHGFIGLIIFINFITYPIRKASTIIRPQVIGLFIFLFVECCVLEPIFRGYLTFLLFYVFIYKLAVFKNVKE